VDNLKIILKQIKNKNIKIVVFDKNGKQIDYFDLEKLFIKDGKIWIKIL